MFKKTDLRKFPVSKKVSEYLASNPASKGDTTGCGDNFAGGVIASLAMQLRSYETGELNFKEAIAWGVASGGLACFYLGGTFLENSAGEKLKLVEVFKNEYNNQISLDNGGVKKKIVLFGAGKIGRSFIGQLFSRGGYEVVFINLNKTVIDELNNRRNYDVKIKGDKELTINIRNVRGVFAGDEQNVNDEISGAGIIAVSVGLNGLNFRTGCLQECFEN